MFKKLTNDNFPNHEKMTYGSSFAGITLNVSLKRLLEVFGQPSKVGSGDNKVQLEWIFFETTNKNLDPNSKGDIITEVKLITIYDYRDSCAIHNIHSWHVGGKNIKLEEIITYLVFMRLDKNRDEIVVGR